MAAMAQRQKRQSTSNPKLDPNPQANMEKKPEEWVSGDDPMTGAEASYLKTLCEQAGEPEAFDESLTKAEASKRIDELKQELGFQDDPSQNARTVSIRKVSGSCPRPAGALMERSTGHSGGGFFVRKTVGTTRG
jgi:hypothetical protein